MTEEWAIKAAKAVLLNLEGRKGIGNELESIDREIYVEIEETLAEIIQQSRKSAEP